MSWVDTLFGGCPCALCEGGCDELLDDDEGELEPCNEGCDDESELSDEPLELPEPWLSRALGCGLGVQPSSPPVEEHRSIGERESVRTGCAEPPNPPPDGAGADGPAGLKGAPGVVPPGTVDAIPLTAEVPGALPSPDIADITKGTDVTDEPTVDTAPHTAETASRTGFDPDCVPPLSTDWTVARLPVAAVVAVPVVCATVEVALATACDTVVWTTVGDTGCTVGGAIGALVGAAAAAC